MFKIQLIAILALFFLPICSIAQSDKAEVQTIIEQLFEGMRAKNMEAITNSFSAEAIMQTIAPVESGFQVNNGSVTDFVK
jgi:Tfp pilus assembly protein PilV